MDILSNLGLGLAVALTLQNLAYCFLGVLLGTLIGVLPGLGAVTTVAILLPITFTLPAAPALIMLAGIYYGAQYGGSTTAILVNIPGEAASIITVIDGHKLALKGRAGPALGISAIGSFIAGTLGTLVIALFAPPLAEFALHFNSAEYFSLMLFGLVAAIVLAQGSTVKAVAMVILGLLLGLVGTDVNSGAQRFSFGIPELIDGVSFIGLTMGLFGLTEVIFNLENPENRKVLSAKIDRILPTRDDMRLCAWPILRSTALGSVLGVLPGGGALLGAFGAYTMEKKLARPPNEFGQGDIRGVAAAETANNAGAQTSFIPMLTLGIPSNPTMALMIGALMIQGIAPGPQVMTQKPELFWGIVASMWVGNLLLLVLNLPLIGIWIRLLTVPYRMLYPAIIVFCAVGALATTNSVLDVYMVGFFTVVGYVLFKLDCEPAPLILGFILGPMMEENVRRALLISQGDPSVFVTQPISLACLLGAFGLLMVLVAPSMRSIRGAAFKE